MDFKDTWKDQDETMDASPEVVNSIAHAVIKNEEDIAKIKENGGTGGGGGLTPEELEKLNKAESVTNKKTVIDETANDIDYPTTKAVWDLAVLIKQAVNATLNDYYNVPQIDEKFGNVNTRIDNEIGNIEAALDNIIAIQNQLIGGDSV